MFVLLPLYSHYPLPTNKTKQKNTPAEIYLKKPSEYVCISQTGAEMRRTLRPNPSKNGGSTLQNYETMGKMVLGNVGNIGNICTSISEV